MNSGPQDQHMSPSALLLSTDRTEAHGGQPTVDAGHVSGTRSVVGRSCRERREPVPALQRGGEAHWSELTPRVRAQC